ncbi:MAG: hypothetical protein JW850_11895 [Thermoflexales bacterium]|nr:hypothetical protein [Thermoflexales bacterium]
MQRSRSAKSTLSIIVVLLALLLSGCIVKDSPAPGCIESIGPPMAGGCFGKTVILDLTIAPENECLVIKANNCNGGVLEVDNSCTETLVLDGVEVPSQARISLDVIEENGSYSLVEVNSNFSNYVPAENERLVMTGRLGSQEVRLAFTKTAPLCE